MTDFFPDINQMPHEWDMKSDMKIWQINFISYNEEDELNYEVCFNIET